jgi:hypothetical protein
VRVEARVQRLGERRVPEEVEARLREGRELEAGVVRLREDVARARNEALTDPGRRRQFWTLGFPSSTRPVSAMSKRVWTG